MMAPKLDHHIVWYRDAKRSAALRAETLLDHWAERGQRGPGETIATTAGAARTPPTPTATSAVITRSHGSGDE